MISAGQDSGKVTVAMLPLWDGLQCADSGTDVTTGFAGLTTEAARAAALLWSTEAQKNIDHFAVANPAVPLHVFHAGTTNRVGLNHLCYVADWTDFTVDSDPYVALSGFYAGRSVELDDDIWFGDTTTQMNIFSALKTGNMQNWNESTVYLFGSAFGFGVGTGSLSDNFRNAAVLPYMQKVGSHLQNSANHYLSADVLPNNTQLWGIGALILLDAFAGTQIDEPTFAAAMTAMADKGENAKAFTDVLGAGRPFERARAKFTEFLKLQTELNAMDASSKDKTAKAAYAAKLAEVGTAKNAALTELDSMDGIMGRIGMSLLSVDQLHFVEVMNHAAAAMRARLGAKVEVVQPKQPKEPPFCVSHPDDPKCKKAPPPKAKTCDEDPSQAKCQKAPPVATTRKPPDPGAY